MVTLIVHWVAVVVATIVAMIVGMIWYSPMLFGGAWMEGMGTKKGAKMKMPAKGMVLALISAFLVAFWLGAFIGLLHATSLKGALEVAGGIWLGFFVTKELVSTGFGRSSSKLFAIQVVHDLVVLAIMAAIFTYILF